jgi:hypothetical protein
VGSRSKIVLAYIAGFLDGDGSLMLQVKRRKDSIRGVRFMATICFYQHKRHKLPLYWIRRELGVGYLSSRNDDMFELRINGFKQVGSILNDLLPYLKFKKVQAIALQQACIILNESSFKCLSQAQLKNLVSLILKIQQQNYGASKKKTRGDLCKILDLTP